MTTTSTQAGSQTPVRKMKVGVAGLGAGAVAVIRAMASAPYIEITAAADVRQESLDAFEQRFGAKGYTSVAAMCDDPNVEVVWVSTPNQFHCEHTITAAERGKHVVVEKPMALNLEEAERMAAAAEKYGVHVLCGHTASLMAANQAMRGLVASGELGKLAAINVWSYSDWMFRPRAPQEVDLKTGGGVVYRQGPHQVDTVRMLGGGKVKSVRANIGQWFPGRPVEGYYVAFMEFESGVPATIVHNGYGYFSTSELVPWTQRPGARGDAPRALRKALRAGSVNAEAEIGMKDMVRFGGERETAESANPSRPESTGFQPDLGIVIASCERGDIRQSPHGLWVYDDEGQREVPVEGIHDERMAELDEMYQAITTGRKVRHDARWGTATLEVVLAIRQSALEHREITLSHQWDAYGS